MENEAVIVKDISKQPKKLKVLVSILVFGVLAGGGLYLYFNYNKIFQTIVPKELAGEPAVVESGGEVQITNYGFIPGTISIKKGSSVTWTNQDREPHQVATDPYPIRDNLAGFDSEEALITRDSFTYIFEQSGRYTYHDPLNPQKFKGIVVVE